MTHKQSLTTTSTDVARFLDQVKQTPMQTHQGQPGRLVFSLDATLSRATTWDTASRLQAEMFQQAMVYDGLSMQLCYYRGFNEFVASPWCTNSQQLLQQMTGVQCRGGYTQIARVFKHALQETRLARITALVFIGDALEEDADQLCQLAGQLGILHVPIFIFQEGSKRQVKDTFKQVAHLSGGGYAPFNTHSAKQLKELLAAVAIYAAGGQSGLQKLQQSSSPAVRQLIQQVKA